MKINHKGEWFCLLLFSNFFSIAFHAPLPSSRHAAALEQWVEVSNPRGPPQGSLNHEGDGENSVLLQSAAALRCIWLLPRHWENSLGVILTQGSFHLQRIMSCWEEWDKRQQMNQEILMIYNLSQKISISTCFFSLPGQFQGTAVTSNKSCLCIFSPEC